MAVKPVPEGYRTVTTYLTVDNAADAIQFYGRAFGARERSRMPMPDGKIAHAEIEIGDSIVMLSDPMPQASTKAPKELGGSTAGVFLYVDDTDAAFKKAVDAGATSLMEPENMFWGDRFATVQDPFGHTWSMATHVEDVPPEEMEERAKAMFAQA
jgi:PhnB protein